MKRSMKLLSAVLVTAVMAGMTAVPVSALGTNYTPVNGEDDVEFDKYLLINEDTNVPTLTFNYTISGASVTPIPATSSSYLPVYAGGTATANVIFDDTVPQITPTTDVAFDDTLYDGYMKSVTIDFSSNKYTEPGVYRYYVTEVDNNVGGLFLDVDATNPTATITPADNNCKRTIDVYVEDNTTPTGKNLNVIGYVMYLGHITAAAPASTTAANAAITTATKSDHFVNYFDTNTLTFGKEVTGNQGSRDKYFDFTLTLTSPVTETAKVTFHNADGTVAADVNDATTVSGTNVQTIDLTANTAVATHFYLQDGQYITVSGLAVNTGYTLAEDAEDYTSTEGITQALSTLNWDADPSTGTATDGFDALTDSVSGTITTANIHTGFTNDKQGVIPTGVLLKIAPVAGIAFVVVAGVIFFAVMSVKRRESEELETENQ